MKRLFRNATLINEGRSFTASLLTSGALIEHIYEEENSFPEGLLSEVDEVIPAEGLWLLPGCIDDQVHFREPGLTHKATIESESRAAVAGGTTSFMEMPNTKPPYDQSRGLGVEDAACRRDLVGQLLLLLRGK